MSRLIETIKQRYERSIARKINLLVIGSGMVVMSALIFMITTRSQSVIMANAKQAVIEQGRENAYKAIDFVNKKVSALKTLSTCFESQDQMGDLKFDLYNNMIKDIAKAEANIFGIWYVEDFLSEGSVVTKRGIEVHDDSFDKSSFVQRLDNEVAYCHVRSTGELSVSEPFRVGKSWMINIVYPLIVEGKNVGAVGYIVPTTFFDKLMVSGTGGSCEFNKIISNSGVIIAHTQSKKVGGAFDEGEQTDEIFAYIAKGEEYNGTAYSSTFGADAFKVFIPIFFDGDQYAWSFCTAVPVNVMNASSRQIMLFAYLFLVVAFVILALLIAYVSRRLVEPIVMVSDELELLADGKMDRVKTIDRVSKDEIGLMVASLNKLKDSFKQMASFVSEVGKGNLDVHIDIKSSEDTISTALMDMRHNLVLARQAEEQRKKQDEINAWKVNGNMQVNERIRANGGTIKELCSSVLRELLSYANIIQGGIYVVNDADDNEDQFVELVACIAYNRKKMGEKHIGIDEGLVGRCIFERAPIILTELPSNYLEITSGLGDMSPSFLGIFPLISNDIVVGVLEVASFTALDEHVVEYLSKGAESLASSIVSVRTNERTERLLEKTKLFAEEVGAQEEELRQNMEEMHASQEEMLRKTEEYENTIRELQAQLTEKEV